MLSQVVASTSPEWSFWLLPLLTGAVGGGLVTGLFGLLRSRHESKTEHARWLRDKRLEVYSSYYIRLSAIARVIEQSGERKADIEKLAEVFEARDLLRLIAPYEVWRASTVLNASIGGLASTHGSGAQLNDPESANAAAKARENYDSAAERFLEVALKSLEVDDGREPRRRREGRALKLRAKPHTQGADTP